MCSFVAWYRECTKCNSLLGAVGASKQKYDDRSSTRRHCKEEQVKCDAMCVMKLLVSRPKPAAHDRLIDSILSCSRTAERETQAGGDWLKRKHHDAVCEQRLEQRD